MEHQKENNTTADNKSTKKSNRSPPYALFNLVVILVAIGYAVYVKFYINDAETDQAVKSVDQGEYKIPMFTAEELKQYNGEGDNKILYLAIMGEIFDVTRGEKHYGPGQSYHSFVGVDASKAFITGEFDAKNGKSTGLDHVLSLSPSELVSLKKWRDFYADNYDFVGRLIGRFYEVDGNPTEYFWSIDRKIQFGIKQQEEEKNFHREFPPCNMEYKKDKGTRFWCTKQSGGIDRDWAGYPIQLFNQDSKTYSCVCALKENFDLPQFRRYENCEEQIRTCFVATDEQSNDD
ncbi:neuferricin [Chironomus tepperi]|uniref:neuferricin n=1 Tax=Chironomus tepperi TaxID=113505 RepID=UPI00391F1DFD